MTLLDKLRAHSEIIHETAELSVLRELGARHVSLSASRITAAAQLPEHAAIVDAAVAWAQKGIKKGGSRRLVAIHAVQRLTVAFAEAIAQVVEGRVSIEIDGRLAYKRRQTIEAGRAIIEQLQELGVGRERVLLKIPATLEGIEAARKLHEKDGIDSHITLVFGMHQLAAAADAGAALISPAVGRITDWHKKKDGVEGYPPDEDPGVVLAIAMYDYLSAHRYPSVLAPEMFRSFEQAVALAGCELLSLPPKLWSLLDANDHEVPLKVTARPERAPAKLELDAGRFNSMHAADEVALSKLAASLQNLSWAIVSQEKQLVEWIGKRQDEAAETSALALFRIWDYDGDGFIDREEWGGTEEVFNALDRDNNGRISLAEMAVGLGAPYKPED